MAEQVLMSEKKCFNTDVSGNRFSSIDFKYWYFEYPLYNNNNNNNNNNFFFKLSFHQYIN